MMQCFIGSADQAKSDQADLETTQDSYHIHPPAIFLDQDNSRFTISSPDDTVHTAITHMLTVLETVVLWCCI